ncbi:ferritin-like domain-containing protein [Arenimonas terrae]|uniref:Ferritin-like domain-containing protein n=1 Tax=Arenimonas terrae TaxID=2546226 RepID=A0A5C4RVS4_9GAMM|nr:ferritin-like domain-containing protein [Arenimonas terrae]TNJ35270.1 ferritin-like domain-containing protein [Arenimonas terrae]
MRSLFDAARACLDEAEPARKVALTHAAATAFRAGELGIPDDAPPPAPITAPGRPETPRLVHPRDVPQRGMGTVEGRAAFLHAIAHIEFNAVNLAWDAVYRFRGMPVGYYADWVGVADDEARHFAMLSARMAELGAAYGDHAAHNGLWEMAEKTADDCRVRMALVPRVLEARGLDVTPGMIARLRGNGDAVSAEILEVILREEVAHVAAGTRWYHWCCAREGLAPGPEFIRLVREVARSSVRGPFNRPARAAAGFDDDEMRLLEAME